MSPDAWLTPPVLGRVFLVMARHLVSPVATASASFLTPIGYQTNLMVYGPGGYRFTDYARLGIPLTILLVVVVLVLIPLEWGL